MGMFDRLRKSEKSPDLLREETDEELQRLIGLYYIILATGKGKGSGLSRLIKDFEQLSLGWSTKKLNVRQALYRIKSLSGELQKIAANPNLGLSEEDITPDKLKSKYQQFVEEDKVSKKEREKKLRFLQL